MKQPLSAGVNPACALVRAHAPCDLFTRAANTKSAELTSCRVATAIVRTPFPLTCVRKDGTPGDATSPGCRVYGTMSIKRVTGAFYVAAPRMMTPFGMFGGQGVELAKFNASHTITHLSFGPMFPNMVFPMDAHTSPHTETVAMYQYHVKVVPTVYESLSGQLMDTNQFSASDFTQELFGVRACVRCVSSSNSSSVASSIAYGIVISSSK